MDAFLCGNSPLLLVMQEYQIIGAMDGVSCLDGMKENISKKSIKKFDNNW